MRSKIFTNTAVFLLIAAVLLSAAGDEKCFASEPGNYLIKPSKFLQGSAGDRWFAIDKYRHLMASAMLTGLLYNVSRVDARQPRGSSLTVGVSVTLAAGVGKEVYDLYHPGHVSSWRDLLADLAGIALGVLCFGRY